MAKARIAAAREHEPLDFASLRSDWYASNQATSRALCQSALGTRPRTFIGFPRQWIPLFEYLGVCWESSSEPAEYVPLISDLSEQQLLQLVNKAKARGQQRVLLEALASLDPILSDCLYIVDHRLPTSFDDLGRDGLRSRLDAATRIPLTSWQSYGRPSVRALESLVRCVRPRTRIAIALPCARARPYDRSRTHRRIYDQLRSSGIDVEGTHRVVISAMGVLPEEVWRVPQVLAYDAGVPDIYRILQLGRSYFSRARYQLVYDCLEYPPYSDVLELLHREGVIRAVKHVPAKSRRHFVAKF